MLAHEKNADWDYLAQREVDYIFSFGFGFFTEGYPLPLTQPNTYIVKLPEDYFSFRTTNSREEILSRFGAYPIQYRTTADEVIMLR
jgi:hypothetical protein